MVYLSLSYAHFSRMSQGLLRSSEELIVHCKRETSRGIPCPSIVTKRERTHEESSSFRAAQISRQGPLNPILRANPFPEITDPLCRHVFTCFVLWMTMTMTMTHSEKSNIHQSRPGLTGKSVGVMTPLKKESVALMKLALLARCAQTHC